MDTESPSAPYSSRKDSVPRWLAYRGSAMDSHRDMEAAALVQPPCEYRTPVPVEATEHDAHAPRSHSTWSIFHVQNQQLLASLSERDVLEKISGMSLEMPAFVETPEQSTQPATRLETPNHHNNRILTSCDDGHLQQEQRIRAPFNIDIRMSSTNSSKQASSSQQPSQELLFTDVPLLPSCSDLSEDGKKIRMPPPCFSPLNFVSAVLPPEDRITIIPENEPQTMDVSATSTPVPYVEASSRNSNSCLPPPLPLIQTPDLTRESTVLTTAQLKMREAPPIPFAPL